MTALTWAHFARVHYSATVDSVVLALGLEIPLEGRPWQFVAGPHPEYGSGHFSVQVTDSPGQWVLFSEGASSIRSTDDVLAAARRSYLTKGTPTGDALRRWMALWTTDT